MSATNPDALEVHHAYPTKTKKAPSAIVANLIRGAFIGMAELVPGISGGTVALILGIYERALHNGEELLHLAKVLIKDRAELKSAFRRIDWWFLGAVALGMITAVFSMSTLLSGFVENYPEISRGLFLGMVAVSIIVPIGMMDLRDVKRRLPIVIPLFLACAAASFFGTGISSAPRTDPSLILIFVAAAIAVCALVLPGISGSFFLLAVGLYAPIMSALSNRDWGVILVFIAGALTGVALFIKVLSYILEHHRTITLTIMAGLMLGSLRALWPWQSADAQLLAPSETVWPIIAAIVIGALFVGVVILIERISSRKVESEIMVSEPPR